MENQEVSGAEVTQIVETKQDALTKEAMDLAIKQATEEVNKKWQSRFDTVLGEKKTVESKGQTLEQRLEQIEQERERERLDWSRKEAKAKFQIDDELDAAINQYASKDAESIKNGAVTIRNVIDKMIATKTEQAVKAALEKIGSQPTPSGGSGNQVEITRESLKTPEGRKAMMELAKKQGGSIPIIE
jgi:hypothetical protein